MYKLEYYKSKFRNIFEQGSDDWLEGRRYAFGGSEIATVLDEDPYTNFTELLQKKKTKENLREENTEWGKLFEPVAKIFITIERKTKIHEFSSIPHCYYPVCYSPDGILVEEDDLVLLEIKCPIRRNIHYIPSYYLHQIKTGMCILNVKHTIFAQYRFRRCAIWTDPNSPSYDRVYHKDFKTRPAKPITYGYLYWKSDCPLVDLGIKHEMVPLIPKGRPEIIIADKDFKPNYGHVLMWKLFEIKYDIIEPERDYLQKNETKLWAKYHELRNFLNG